MSWRVIQADVREGLAQLDAGSVQCVITSPPYFGLRNYGVDGQLGMEATPQAFVCALVEVFREVRRVLRDDGVCFVNLGDSYASGSNGSNYPQSSEEFLVRNTRQARKSTLGGSTGTLGMARNKGASADGLKPKDLCLIPERFALAMQDDGWWVRSRIAWCKTAPMPESVTDRPTNAWEHIWLFTKNRRYYWDADAVRVPMATEPHGRGGDPNGATVAVYQSPGAVSRDTDRPWGSTTGRNLWSYWVIGPEPTKEAHFATFPTEIPRIAISAGTSERGCCPTCGAPWRRVVERGPGLPRERDELRNVPPGSTSDGRDTISGGALLARRAEHPHQDLGWQPSCSCPDHEPTPCTVLDPFAGSGTTLLVAERLGRDSIGIELSPTYVELARKRINGDAPLWNVAAEVSATTSADGRG